MARVTCSDDTSGTVGSATRESRRRALSPHHVTRHRSEGVIPSGSVRCSPAVHWLRYEAGSAPVPTSTDGGTAGERTPEATARASQVSLSAMRSLCSVRRWL
jgi:hypothetical protein